MGTGHGNKAKLGMRRRSILEICWMIAPRLASSSPSPAEHLLQGLKQRPDLDNGGKSNQVAVSERRDGFFEAEASTRSKHAFGMVKDGNA